MAGFEFVNVTNPSEVKQHSTKIRRHVMRDIGKARRKSKPRRRARANTINTTTTTTEGGEHGIEEEGRPSYAEMSRSITSEPVLTAAGESVLAALAGGMEEPGLFDNYADRMVESRRQESRSSEPYYPPFEMAEEPLDMAQYVSPVSEKPTSAPRPFRSEWPQRSFTDPGQWNGPALMDTTAAVPRSFSFDERNVPRIITSFGEPEDLPSPVSPVDDYMRSLESILSQLQNPRESKNDSVIVTVAQCIYHDASFKNFERMEAHLQGMKRIVDERGGLNQLSSPHMRLMISWLDLSTASILNTIPYFPPPRESITETEPYGDTLYLDALLARWDIQCHSLGDLMGAIQATARVAAHLNRRGDYEDGDPSSAVSPTSSPISSHPRASPSLWCDDVTMARLLAPALHAILSLEGRALPADPLDPRYSAVAAREAFRRAALILMAGVRRKMMRGRSRNNRRGGRRAATKTPTTPTAMMTTTTPTMMNRVGSNSSNYNYNHNHTHYNNNNNNNNSYTSNHYTSNNYKNYKNYNYGSASTDSNNIDTHTYTRTTTNNYTPYGMMAAAAATRDSSSTRGLGLGLGLEEAVVMRGRPLRRAASEAEMTTTTTPTSSPTTTTTTTDVLGPAAAWGSELRTHLSAFRQISRLPFVDWAVVPELNLWAHVVAAVVGRGVEDHADEEDEEEDDEREMAVEDDEDDEQEQQQQQQSPRRRRKSGAERTWHLTVISGIMDVMGLRTGAQALDVARGVIWVDAVLGEDGAAAALARAIDDYRRRQQQQSQLQQQQQQVPFHLEQQHHHGALAHTPIEMDIPLLVRDWSVEAQEELIALNGCTPGSYHPQFMGDAGNGFDVIPSF